MENIENKELLEAQNRLDEHLSSLNKEELSPDDIAECLKILKKEDEDLYYKYLHKLDLESLSTSAIEMPEHMLKDVLENIPKEKLVNAIEELESDDQFELLDYIKDIDEIKAKTIFNELDDDDKKDILKLSAYKDDEAGSYMQIEVFKAKDRKSVV